jgi:hypothetical protein
MRLTVGMGVILLAGTGTGKAERVGVEDVFIVLAAVGLGVVLTALAVGDGVPLAAVGDCVVFVVVTVGVGVMVFCVGVVGVIVIFVTAALGDDVLGVGGVLVLVTAGGKAIPLPV